MKPLSVKNCTASFAHDEMLPASLNSAADATGTIADATSAAVAVVAKNLRPLLCFVFCIFLQNSNKLYYSVRTILLLY